MKALITSGGKGTRLRPITHTSNKHLIPIANKPMIHFAIEAVAGAGIKEIGIVYNPDTGDEIKKALGTGSQWGVNFTFILQESPAGLAHVIKVAQDFLGNDPFVFYLGDNVVVGGIKRFIDDFEREKSNCHLVLSKVHDPERFGVPDIKDGKIMGVEEKPKKPKSQYAVTGIYIYDATVFEAVNNIKPSARGELEISDAHDYLIQNGYKIGYSEITGWWKDTGKPEDLLEANRLTLDRIIGDGDPVIDGEVDDDSDIAGKVIIEKGARIINSSIRGPVIIGENTVIENSYIGPFTSIYYDCHIKDSEVEYSIILEKCKIIDADIRIERSLLGREAEIIKCKTKPRTQKFIIGDQSIVELV